MRDYNYGQSNILYETEKEEQEGRLYSIMSR